MGGEKETIAMQTKEDKSGKIEQCGQVRYHENAGEVHFHDDVNGLKVAIPSGVWFSLFQSLMREVPNSFTYADTKNQAILHVSTKMKKAKKKMPARIETEMYLEKVNVSNELAALQKFTEG